MSKWWALLLLCTGLAWPEERPLSFKVIPGGASIVELGASSTLLQAQPSAPVSTYTLTPDVQAVHHYLIQRPPFDDQLLAIQWDAAAGGWQRQTTTGLSPLDGRTTFILSRTIAIPTVPGGATVWAPTDDGGEIALPSRGGRVTIPSAWNPPPLTLTRNLFDSYLLTLPEGGLDSTTTALPPVYLHPKYGPFSYWQFNTALALLGVGAWGRLLWRRRQSMVVPDAGEEEEKKAPAASLEWVRTQVLITQNGLRLAVHEQLGRGGVGVVFAAVCPQVSSMGPLAVKVMLPDHFDDAKVQGRFLREARLCSTLQHPGLVRVLDWGTVAPPGGGDPSPFLVMERLDGHTLRDVLARGLPTPAQALQWLVVLLDALEAVHQAGVVHRDLKPENVMVLLDGGLKLMDFGVAREVDGQSLTKSGTLIGTPAYMSPEHFNAKTVRPSSDVYSVGVMLYEMLSGGLPYDDGDLWVMAGQILIGTSVPLEKRAPHLPTCLFDLVRKMMATAPEERYQTAALARDAVQAALQRPGVAPAGS